MFRIFPVRRYDYDEPVELGLNMSCVDTIKPVGFTRCALTTDEAFWWMVDGSMEEVVEFLSTGNLSFADWKKQRTVKEG